MDLLDRSQAAFSYYGCIIMTDIFQFSNVYAVKPEITRLLDDKSGMPQECLQYITLPRKCTQMSATFRHRDIYIIHIQKKMQRRRRCNEFLPSIVGYNTDCLWETGLRSIKSQPYQSILGKEIFLALWTLKSVVCFGNLTKLADASFHLESSKA